MSRATQLLTRGGGIAPRALSIEIANGNRFLVLVEGVETERRYLKDLCGKLQFHAYNIVIESPNSDPLHLMEAAIQKLHREKKLAADGVSVAYDQVWVVCDREKQHHHRLPRLKQALALAEEHGVHMAISIPCFEYWLLLHHHHHTGLLADCDAVEFELTNAQGAAGFPVYDKALYPLDFYVLPERVTETCERARKMRQHHTNVDPMKPPRYWAKDYILRADGANQPDGNPCTDVDELVRQLNLAANPSRRFVPYPELPAAPFY